MQDATIEESSFARKVPWNKGKLTGAKPPLQPKHVWAIRTHPQLAGKQRDLALFNVALDSKLRGCDVVALRIEDIAPPRLCARPGDGASAKDRPAGSI